MVKTISVENALPLNDVVFIDTRTPKEFTEDHLPKAINLPILSDEERAIVGTLYKQVSRDDAINRGVEFFSQKLPQFMRAISKYKSNKIIAYCWRGGMRSRAVAALLESLQYDILQLEGGYKKYREFIRTKLENYNLKPKVVLLCGLTCTGKTSLLHQLSHSLDLEGLARHRGSLYGAIGLTPRSQKAFENNLFWRLEELRHEKYIFVEGESRRIGDVIIPLFLWQAMNCGIIVKVTRSMERRVQEALDNYGDSPQNIAEIKQITKSLWKVIGKEKKELVLQFLEENNFPEAIKLLLQYYYDPLYSHTLKKFTFQFEINNDDVSKAAAILRERFV